MTVNGTHYTGHAIVGTLKPGMSVMLESNGRGCGGLMEESQYATVKRSPRLPKADRNVYDYPGELTRCRHTDIDRPVLEPLNCSNFETITIVSLHSAADPKPCGHFHPRDGHNSTEAR